MGSGRRLRLAGVAIALLVALAAVARGQEEAASRPAAEAPPNIVLFLVDDLGWQDVAPSLRSMATPVPRPYRTPHLEGLAAAGLRFTDAYASAPVCTPTRTSIMTGSSPGRSHITYWTLHRDRDTSREHPTLRPPAWRLEGLQPGAPTLASLLRDAGYRTIHVGKAHFAAHDTPGADPRALGFDVNVAGHASGAPASYEGRHAFSAAGRRGDPDGGPSVWDVPGLEAWHGRDVHLTDVLAIEAEAAVRGAVAAGRPFFLHMAPYAVHTPIMANPRRLEDEAWADETEAAYASMIAGVDAALGRLLRVVDELGVADRTLVVFTSDNGGLSAVARGGPPHVHNAPLRSGKGSAYEGGTRVPFVVRWPGVVEAGRVSATPVVSHDLYPTLLAAAGVEVPAAHAASVDGVDLGPVLRGGDAIERLAPLAWHQPHQWGASGPGIEPFTSIRVGDHKLIYFHGPRRLELYDLAADIGERQDLADQRPDTLAALAARLDAWIAAAGLQLSVDRTTGAAVPLPGALLRR